MRGKPYFDCTVSPMQRITPAHAGKTTGKAGNYPPPQDHPRACGENATLIAHRESRLGSPPRMRGKRVQTRHHGGGCGITPAHAGKTRKASLRHILPPDHPRACGENLSGHLRQGPEGGSPPRMRGKQKVQRPANRGSRITPAHAGKTLPDLLAAWSRPDHPRACGENKSVATDTLSVSGSPPRMRGKRGEQAGGVAYGRITPAHAGKTPRESRHLRPSADHPRACGENIYAVEIDDEATGSPPRMRGKRWPPSRGTARTRITPAHAGKTWALTPSVALAPDHPRACGENPVIGQSKNF